MIQRPKGSWQNFFSSRLYLMGGATILLFLLISFGRSYYQQYQVRQEIRRLEGEVARLEGTKLETIAALSYAQSPAFVEEKARRELNLVKPGEKMAIINAGDSGGARPPIIDPAAQSAATNNLVKWWRYFFNHQK